MVPKVDLIVILPNVGSVEVSVVVGDVLGVVVVCV